MARRFLLALIVTASALHAQQQLSIDIALPAGHAPTASDGPTIMVSNVFGDSTTREDLHHGFPTKLHYKIELWRKGGSFLSTDSRESVEEWDVVVAYEPASQIYNIGEKKGTQALDLGHRSSVTDVEALIDHPRVGPLGPKEHGDRYYYVAQLEVTSVSGNDLDETLRWLNGELKPAVSGKGGNLFSAIKNGILTGVGRLLGKKQAAHRSSAIFTAG